MQDPDLLRRKQTLVSSICGYAAASSVAATIVVRAASASRHAPTWTHLGLETLPSFVGGVVVLACLIATVASVPTVMIAWLSKRYAKTIWRLFAITGVSIGGASGLAFAVVQGSGNRLAGWLGGAVPFGIDPADLFTIGAMVALLAGAMATVTYRMVAGFEPKVRKKR